MKVGSILQCTWKSMEALYLDSFNFWNRSRDDTCISKFHKLLNDLHKTIHNQNQWERASILGRINNKGKYLHVYFYRFILQLRQSVTSTFFLISVILLRLKKIILIVFVFQSGCDSYNEIHSQPLMRQLVQ